MTLNTIDALIQRLTGITLVSENEVRTQFAVPLLDLLGYPRANWAEEFPIRGIEARSSLNIPPRAKRADIVLFDSTDHSDHRDSKSRGWVEDHTLVIVELKKPGESLDDAQGQAQFYAHWAKAPFYVMTNGEEIVCYRMQSFFNDVREVSCAVEKLPREWHRISKLLSFAAVKRYRSDNEIKTQSLPTAAYADYLKAAYSELSTEVELSMERTVSEKAETGPLAFPVGLSGSVDGHTLSSAPYPQLLDLCSSVVVTAGLGGGKTHLIKMLARDLIRATEEDPEAPIPVVLPARLWGRDFNSIAEGVKKKIDDFVPGIAVESTIQEDLEVGRFVLLVDGLDEVRDRTEVLYAECVAHRRSPPSS